MPGIFYWCHPKAEHAAESADKEGRVICCDRTPVLGTSKSVA